MMQNNHIWVFTTVRYMKPVLLYMKKVQERILGSGTQYHFVLQIHVKSI